MAPNRDNNNHMTKDTGSSYSSLSRGSESKIVHKNLPRLSMESLQRTISDISLELITEQAFSDSGDCKGGSRASYHVESASDDDSNALQAISEVEEVRCECCGMAEECTGEYVGRVRAEFGGRVVCGLCAEAVAVEMAKRGGAARDEALRAHIAACSRFNRLGRAYPSLFQAQAVKEILKKTNGSSRAKSPCPRDIYVRGGKNNSGLARSSSCIPALTKES